ncbi:hypothetical protein, partial [Burkholderia ubonensis]|uniref:hypothetical protein n=1 Tax=Burkholderia ubonensis TaxID=101571 RepID=UPI001E29E228
PFPRLRLSNAAQNHRLHSYRFITGSSSLRFQIDAAAFDHLALFTVAETKQAPVLSISSATRGEYDTHPVAMVIHALPVSKRIST